MKKNYLFIVKDLTDGKTYSNFYDRETLECTDMKNFIPTRKGQFKERTTDDTMEIILKVN
jgi:hypothetical protein